MSAAARTPPGFDGGWEQLARASFVSVGTYRRNGQIVATPVWVAADGARLVLTSEVNTGKVKRLRNDARVRLQVCDRFGRVHAEASEVAGVARLLDDEGETRRALQQLRRKYGIQFPLILGLERLVRRLQRRSGARVIITMEPAPVNG